MKHVLQTLARTLIAACLSVVVASCSGGDDGLSVLRTCGNGTVEAGEECDAGGVCSATGDRCRVSVASGCADNEVCVAADTSTCSSICNVPLCGDGLAQGGLEQCDTFDLRDATCGDFGRGDDPQGGPAGGLTCTDSCTLNPSACGGVFTPTSLTSATPTVTETPATQAPTATATNTPEPTATPTPPCNLPLLEPGERAEDPDNPGTFLGDPAGTDCSQDIEILDCAPDGGSAIVLVAFSAPPGPQATSITTLLSYQSDVVQMPGTGRVRDVADRIQEILDPDPFIFTPSDLDFAARVVLVNTTELPSDEIYVATFDTCDGAAGPDATSFACIVEGCSGAGGPIAGCTCSATLQ